MKKTLLALAAAAAATATTGAFAADSVTLYGVADAWLGQSKVAANPTQTVVNSGGLSTSRLGVTVKEDLGDGLSAFSQMEYGISIDNPSGGSNAPRKSVVGLAGSFGSVALGFQATPYDDVSKTILDAQSNSTSFSTVRYGWSEKAAPSVSYGGTKVAFAHTERFTNSVRYDTPNFDGFQAAVQLDTRPPAAGAPRSSHDYSLNAKYAQGPLSLAIAYQQEEAAWLTTGSFAKRKNTALGGNYDFGPAKLFLAYNNASLPSLASGATPTLKGYNLGVSVPVDAFTFIAQVSQMKPRNTANDNNITALGLEGRYALSKRTTAYVGYLQRKQTATTVNNELRNFGIGLRHTF